MSKIDLLDYHKQRRLSFAREYLEFDWCNNVVIFTDEKTFKSDKDGRKILWRRDGERYKEINILHNRCSGRVIFGYWGWMSSIGPGELVKVGSCNSGERYFDILRNECCRLCA